jgi:hypothetical protein
MNLDFRQVVEECIARMRAGASLESCLERYPQYAKDLQPILRTARSLQALKVPQERLESVQAGRERLFAAYAQKTAAQQAVSESSFPRLLQRILTKLTGKEILDMKLVARFAIALLLVVSIILGGGITAKVSASALPGDALYPLKLGLEDLNLLFANDPQVRQQIELQNQATRQQEVQSVLKLGRQTTVHFVGIVSVINPDSWIIGGLPVNLDSATQVVGAAAPGMIINVEGETRADGTILAHTLTVQGQATPMVPPPGSTPMGSPTSEPTHQATPAPSMMPTRQSTSMPTMMATNQPTSMPTMMSTTKPTSMPTMMSTNNPTSMPTMMPTNRPTMSPTHQPTSMPTMMPTMKPGMKP